MIAGPLFWVEKISPSCETKSGSSLHLIAYQRLPPLI